MKEETTKYLILAGTSLLIASILTLILRRILSVFINKYSARLKSNPTNFTFIKNSVGFLIYGAAIIYIFHKIPFLKSVGTALFASAGILAVAVGFASQKAFSNIISGIFILIFKPFQIGDIVELKDGQIGVVDEITLRHTIIKNYENRRIVIPNSVISEDTILNSSITDERIRKHIIFSISYDSNIDHAMNIIREEAENHPLTIDVRSSVEKREGVPKVITRTVGLNDFSVDIKAYVWSKNNDDAFTVKCDLLKSVKERFDKEGIEIPFPYRTIVYKKDIEK